MALHISYMVKHARDTAVKASISTPVFPTVFTSASTSIASANILNLISAPVKNILWHMGIKSLVFLAPIMPPIWATANTSPFSIRPSLILFMVSLFILILPLAVAVLLVSSLWLTSTIWALPSSLK